MPYVSKRNMSRATTRLEAKLPSFMVSHLKDEPGAKNIGRSIDSLVHRVTQNGFVEAFNESLRIDVQVEEILVHQGAVMDDFIRQYEQMGDDGSVRLLESVRRRLQEPLSSPSKPDKKIDTRVGEEAQALFEQLRSKHGNKASRERVLRAMVCFDRARSRST